MTVVAGRGSRFTRPAKGADFSRSKGTVVGRLYGDLEFGEGDVTLILEFDGLTLEMQRDLLDDWIGVLEQERERLQEDAIRYYTGVVEDAKEGVSA